MSYLGRLNSVLRSNHLRTSAKERSGLSVGAQLPDWVERGTSLVYVSKSNNSHHTVKVKAIEERKQTVVIVFESDRRIWKRVPFAHISKIGDSVLQPLWKNMESPTVPNRPKGFVDDSAGVEQGPVLGPAPASVEDVAADSGDDDDKVEIVDDQKPEQSTTRGAQAAEVASATVTAPEPSVETVGTGAAADAEEDERDAAAEAALKAMAGSKKKKRKKNEEDDADDRKQAKSSRTREKEARRAVTASP